MVNAITAWGAIELIELKSLQYELGFELELLVKEYVSELEAALAAGKEDPKVFLDKIIGMVELKAAASGAKRNPFLHALRAALLAKQQSL
jgi:hypothetical protein